MVLDTAAWLTGIASDTNFCNSVLTTKSTSPKLKAEEFVKNYFDANIADPSVSETCLQYMLCDYLHQESGHKDSEVAVLLSSAKRLYVLSIDAASDGSGSMTIRGILFARYLVMTISCKK
ncbi:hypothetical protein GIB67_019757 [Kingdonia uniflora]|uniref:Uncharacterized protein n=1 Tax=Kingdonia uniflora TaxID=39325 RepID=A0A7J7MK25_9MAGN|nr:hypothetical protein GIB67_019757 [Kingdonia uniflora]